MLEGGFSGGILLTVVGVVAGLATTAVTIASAVGAFTPDNPGGNGTESTIDPKQQIIDLQTNFSALAEQEKKDQADAAAAQATARKWQYAALGVAAVGAIATALVLMEKNKKK